MVTALLKRGIYGYNYYLRCSHKRVIHIHYRQTCFCFFFFNLVLFCFFITDKLGFIPACFKAMSSSQLQTGQKNSFHPSGLETWPQWDTLPHFASSLSVSCRWWTGEVVSGRWFGENGGNLAAIFVATLPQWEPFYFSDSKSFDQGSKEGGLWAQHGVKLKKWVKHTELILAWQAHSTQDVRWAHRNAAP